MRLDDMLLHPATRQATARALTSSAHALLILGQPGTGKHTLARAVAAEYLHVPVERLDTAAYYRQVQPVSKDITIDQIREVQRFTSLKTTGSGAIRRVILISQADTMNVQAQNALLKTLEEPPLDTVLILTASDAEKLLATIRSRTQSLNIASPSLETAQEYFASKGYGATDITKAYAVTTGAAGLMASVLSGQTDSDILEQVDQAKSLLSMKPLERLLKVDELTKDKDAIAGLLLALKRICTGAMEQSIKAGKGPTAQAWQQRLQVVADSEEYLTRQANAKLLLTNLFLAL